MNLLRQCTFLDRYRNSYVELDDIIEENFNNNSINNKNNESNTIIKNDNAELNLILYFTANWLSETNASSKELNKKLTNLSLNKKINNCNKFEILFISSDKTKDSYDKFIEKNKFIRYSLIFQDQDIKNQLCKYFNLNGIPYITMVSLKLNENFKIVDFHADKTNIKYQILSEKNFETFLWINNNNNDRIQKNNLEKKYDNSSNIIEIENKMISNETSVIAQEEDIKPIVNGIKEKTPELTKSLINHENETIYLDENQQLIDALFANLKPIQTEFEYMTNSLDETLNENKFLFILFGSDQTEINNLIVNSWTKFWIQFHLKHKFMVVYISPQNLNDDKNNIDFSQVEWYTIDDIKLKTRFKDYYKVDETNKLIIIDIKTGQVLNNDFKLNLIKYVHEFCYNQLEETNGKIEKINEEEVEVEKSEIKNEFEEIENTIDNENSQNNSINFSLNFDFDNYEIYKKIKNKNGINKKYIDLDLMKQLNESLINVLTYEKFQYKNDTNSSDSHFYYLLYFCSNFTTLNASLLENVIQFLKFMKEKTKCSIKIVLISSDKLIDDYKDLIKRHQLIVNEKLDDQSEFDRLALQFDAKSIKEKLFCQLNVQGIPWVSLINSQNGEILCENLKIFILNSQLREIIF